MGADRPGRRHRHGPLPGGARIIDDGVVRRARLTRQEIASVEGRERPRLDRRLGQLRGDRPPVPLAGRTAVVVDDGIAIGSTARAACLVARARGASRVIVAVPVGSAQAAASLRRDAELSGTGEQRQRRGLRMIGYAFAALAAYLLVQSTVVLATGYHPRHSVPGIIWTAVTAAVMFTLAAGKARTGAALGNPVLRTEGRVTLIDGILATAVLLGLVLNAALGWWWADPAAGYVLIFYAAREVRDIFFTRH